MFTLVETLHTRSETLRVHKQITEQTTCLSCNPSLPNDEIWCNILKDVMLFSLLLLQSYWEIGLLLWDSSWWLLSQYFRGQLELKSDHLQYMSTTYSEAVGGSKLSFLACYNRFPSESNIQRFVFNYLWPITSIINSPLDINLC